MLNYAFHKSLYFGRCWLGLVLRDLLLCMCLVIFQRGCWLFWFYFILILFFLFLISAISCGKLYSSDIMSKSRYFNVNMISFNLLHSVTSILSSFNFANFPPGQMPPLRRRHFIARYFKMNAHLFFALMNF